MPITDYYVTTDAMGSVTAILDEALENANQELRNKVVTTVLGIVFSDEEFTLPMPNEGPEDLIPKVAAAGLFTYCTDLRARYLECMDKEKCNPKCEQIGQAARRCFELTAAAAKIVK